MDKNTITGFVLVLVILLGFGYLNKPSQEQIEAAKTTQDSIQQVELQQQQAIQAQEQAQEQAAATVPDSVRYQNAQDKLGVFASGAVGVEDFYVLENNLMKVTLSNKGGRVYSVELKKYKTYDGKPLILFDGDNTEFGISFFAQNRNIRTEDLYFSSSTADRDVVVSGPEVEKGKEGNEKFNKENPGSSESIIMSLNVGQGRSLRYVYTLKHNSYMMGFDMQMVGLGNVIAQNIDYINFDWAYDVTRQEKKSKFGEDRYTSIHYRYLNDDVEELGAAKSSEEELTTKVQWVSFKQLFFNSTLIADEAFTSAHIKYDYDENSLTSLGRFSADIILPYNPQKDSDYSMKLYFGPNHYNTLLQYDGLELDKLINLGFSVLRWVNKYLVIATFNLLRDHIASFGLIILLLTLFIKLILFPFTYKSYVSQAKMKALKPELDEINEKFPGQDKAMEKQKATMALYKKAGVNPLGGCLPMLFQMPILFAMFYFFPTSIELRGQSFLWATDLSSYDSIFHLPFSIPFYGDHVSLFCLLMTITTIISTKLNSQAQANSAMPGMQKMMYIMPVMFLFILNNYPAGLSYYYFLANLITIGQTFLVRKLVDDQKIRAKITVNKKKPVKRSKFQERLDKMAKEQERRK